MQEVRGSILLRSTRNPYANTWGLFSAGQDLRDLSTHLDAQALIIRADEHTAEQRVVHLLPRIRCSGEVAGVGTFDQVQGV